MCLCVLPSSDFPLGVSVESTERKRLYDDKQHVFRSFPTSTAKITGKSVIPGEGQGRPEAPDHGVAHRARPPCALTVTGWCLEPSWEISICSLTLDPPEEFGRQWRPGVRASSQAFCCGWSGAVWAFLLFKSPSSPPPVALTCHPGFKLQRELI